MSENVLLWVTFKKIITGVIFWKYVLEKMFMYANGLYFKRN